MAVEQGLQLAVDLDEPGAAGERLRGEFADQASGHALGRDGDRLLGRGREGAFGERVDVGQPAGGLQVAHEPLLAAARSSAGVT